MTCSYTIVTACCRWAARQALLTLAAAPAACQQLVAAGGMPAYITKSNQQPSHSSR
jgi:hypothetical protein